MTWDILSAKQERRTIWEQMLSKNKEIGEQKRDFTAEEKAAYEKMEADLARLTQTIDREERLLAMKDEQAAQRDRAGDLKPTGAHASDEDIAKKQEKDYGVAFKRWLAHGNEGITPEQRALMQSKFETRQLGVGTGAAGGFLVPQEFHAAIIESMRAYGGIRNSRAFIMTTSSGAPLAVPTVDETANTGVRIAENTQATDLAPTFGQRIIGAHMYTSRIIRVSLQLLQDSAFDLSRFLTGVMGTRLGRITNTEFTTGTGTGQPQGVQTAATSGVVAGAGNTTTITYANLVALEHSVDPAYRNGAEWMFHDTTLRALKLLMDGQGRPLWMPGIAVREPDTILGYRYVINQDMPVMAASARSILFGDFSKFWVRDVLDIQVARLVERYADFLQVGFMAVSRHDSALLDTAAVRFYQNSAT